MVAKAVLDLGSNSFKVLIAEARDGQLLVRERLKDRVQLLRGFSDGRLDGAAIERGLECMRSYRQRLVAVERQDIRVCGTQALRQGSNSAEFVDAAEELLNVPIQVISGDEEARLIYGGVMRHVPVSTNKRLVIDVGGGSTELALGEGFAPSVTGSIDIGCVAHTEAFFPDDTISDLALERARGYAGSRLRELLSQREFVLEPAVEVIGTSGTAESLCAVADANGWASPGELNAASLRELRAAVCDQRWVPGVGLPGLAPDRVDIFPAGVALMSALFDALGIERLRFVDASMQEGMLYDGVQRRVEDVQWRSVRDLGARFGVDAQQVRRVRQTADRLWAATAEAWFGRSEEYRRLLGWASEVHEIGLQVGARHYHRHGSYIINNSALRGFSRQEQWELSLLVRGHRRGFPALAFGQFEAVHGLRLMRLAALLRVAVVLERSRFDADSPQALEAESTAGGGLHIRLPNAWLDEHALSRRELNTEIDQVKAATVALTYS
ncbi:MAG: Ppx/GppA phosphatase family protein [Pseudomonadota bacterium]